jgi:DNA-directed RNA polymerase subunit beta'
VRFGAALEGKIDRLAGLQENVIIGQLIPAATRLKRQPHDRDRAVGAAAPRHRRCAPAEGDDLAAELDDGR